MSHNNVHHHPSDDQLTEFSAGVLPMSRALCVSAHVEHCHSCQQRLKKMQQLASAQLDTLAPQRVSDALKQSVMQGIKQQAQQQITAPPKPSVSTPVSDGIPRCLRKWVPESFDQLKWTSLTPSVSISELCSEGSGAKAALVKVKAGGNMAHHSHTGDEVTVILKGSYSDEDGCYREGDYVFRDNGHKHMPIATNDQDCICLIVLDAPIQFTGWFSRLLNPLLRFNHRLPAM